MIIVRAKYKRIKRASRFITTKQDVPKRGGGTRTLDLIGFPMIIKMDVAPPKNKRNSRSLKKKSRCKRI